MTSLKWWISASIDWPMMCLMCSLELPIPSLPIDSCAGQAIFLSATMIGAPRIPSSRSTHCSMIFRLSHISFSRIRNRPYASGVSQVCTSKS